MLLLECRLVDLLLFLHLHFVFFLDAIREHDSDLSLLELVDSAAWDKVHKNSLLHLEGVELLLQHFVYEKAHDHPLDCLLRAVRQPPEECLANVLHFRVFRSVVHPLPLALEKFDDLKHCKIHPLFHSSVNQVYNISCLLGKVDLSDPEIFQAIVTLLIAILRSKVLT